MLILFLVIHSIDSSGDFCLDFLWSSFTLLVWFLFWLYLTKKDFLLIKHENLYVENTFWN